MFDTLKALFSSMKWHIQRFMDDFSMVSLLALIGAAIMCASIIAFAGLLGLIPMVVLVFFAMYMVDKRETNKGSLERLGETQITTERQEKAIDEYVALMNRKKKHD